ncbi:RNA-guided pseudouridylation complex pseudouridine synthase subunit Cbf5, partial [archaeon CG_4_10_14_0_2_um_filter_Archaea_38_6]
MKIMGLLPFEKEKRKLVKRYESSTNPEYGLKPEDRTIAELLNSGIINLDKPGGLTSHETADIVRKIMKVKSAGHGGTLD